MAGVGILHGSVTWYCKQVLSVDHVVFQSATLALAFVTVYWGIAWSRQLQRVGKVTNTLSILGLHALGVGAVIGLYATLFTLLNLVVSMFALVGMAVSTSAGRRCAVG